MQLLVVILKKTHLKNKLLHNLAKNGVTGGTVLDGHGMAESLVSMEDLPMFGSLRRLLKDEDKESTNVMLFVMTDEKLVVARKTIKETLGNLDEPNTGIMFTVPITYVKGINEA